MRNVQFPVVLNPQGGILYPDDINLFGRTDLINGVIYGQYFGTDTNIQDGQPPEILNYRTHVTQGELIILLGDQVYAKIFRAAYPQGNKPEDDIALYFFARAENPTSDDWLIDVMDQIMSDALDYFIVQNYMGGDDKIRVQQGVLIS